MRSTIPLGRISGIPVGMHWSALVGIVLLGQLVALTVLPSMAPGLGAGAYWLAGGLAALGLGVAPVSTLSLHSRPIASINRRSAVPPHRAAGAPRHRESGW